MNVITRTITTNANHLATDREMGSVKPGILAADNTTPGDGATTYGKVYAGTVVSKDSSGVYHPCGWQVAQSGGAAVNVMTVEDASNFYVGDTIEIRSNGGEYDAVTIAAGDNPSDLDITANAVGDSGLSIALVDPSANSQPLTYSIADDSGDSLVSISLATDGGGAITTTVAQLAAFINANTIAMGFSASNAETGADVCQAVAATDLTGGVADAGAIVSARSVTATTATTVTWDGATSTFSAGDRLLKTGAYKPSGVLERTVSTQRYVDLSAVAESRHIDVRYAGDLRPDQLTGLSSDLKEAMSGGTYVDPQTTATAVVPDFSGFVFLDV